jgi:Tol biopolymer transport system component
MSVEVSVRGVLRLRGVVALVAASCAGLPAAGQGTQRVSVGPGGLQSNAHSWQAVISGNGRCVVFESLASNLVPDDTNGVQDVFVHDRWTGTTFRASVASDGTQGDGESARPSISHDGRYVAFYSSSTNLVPGDGNGAKDVFVHDLQTRSTIRVSVDSGGGEANGRSIHPVISADGGAVVFHSEATNLAPDGNPQWDVFVHDIGTGATALASLRTDGGWGNDWSEHAVISGDGRLIVYHSDATNLIDDDLNEVEDVFLYDRATGVTSRVSLGWAGGEADGLCVFPSVAAGGRFVAFESDATNLAPDDSNGVRDIFVRDLALAATVRVSVATDGTQANQDCYTPAISRDGRYVVFSSGSDTLVAGDANGLPDAFVHDLHTGETVRVSRGPGGIQANGASVFTSISATGAHVAFQSSARNLVGGDTNGAFDIFVHERRFSPSLLSIRP